MASAPRTGGTSSLGFSLWSTFAPSLTSITPPPYELGSTEASLLDSVNFTVKTPNDLVSVGLVEFEGVFDGTVKDLADTFGLSNSTKPTGTITLSFPAGGAITTNAALGTIVGTGHIDNWALGQLANNEHMTISGALQFDCEGTEPSITDAVA